MSEPRTAVVDASVVLKWQLSDEDCVANARALRDDFFAEGKIELIAPSLLSYELANSLATAVRRRRIPSKLGQDFLENILVMGVALIEIEPSLVLRSAIEYNIAAYDAAYLALAETEDCELWTADRPFRNAVAGQTSRVKWIGDYLRLT